MKTKSDYLSELKKIAEDNKIQGVVVDQLLDILAYYLYEQQATVASAVTESSLSTCTKINSVIAHVKGYMYSVERPHAMKIVLTDKNSTSSPSITQADANKIVGTSVFNGDKFSLLFPDQTPVVGSLYGNTRNRWNTLLVKSIKSHTLSFSTSKKYEDLVGVNIGNELFGVTYDQSGEPISGEGESVATKDSGGKYKYLFSDFTEYWSATRQEQPAIFVLTMQDYGVRLYYNEYCLPTFSTEDSRKLVFYELADYDSINSDDILSIKFNSSILGDKTLINNNWSNNNGYSSFVKSNNQGTISNPYSNSHILNSITNMNEFYVPIVCSEYYQSISEVKEEFDYYLSNKFSSEKSSITEIFMRLTGASMANIVSMAADADIVSYADDNYLNRGDIISAVVLGVDGTYPYNMFTIIGDFLDQYTHYNGYNWKDARWHKVSSTDSRYVNPEGVIDVHLGLFTQYDKKNGRNEFTRALMPDIYDIEVNITVSDWDSSQPDKSVQSGLLSEYLTERYKNRLLKNNLNNEGTYQGYQFTNQSVIELISSSKIYAGVINSVGLSAERYFYTSYVGQTDHESLTPGVVLNLIDANDTEGSSESNTKYATNPRSSAFYAYIRNIKVTIA